MIALPVLDGFGIIEQVVVDPDASPVIRLVVRIQLKLIGIEISPSALPKELVE